MDRDDQLAAAEREEERRRLEHEIAIEVAKQAVESFFVLEPWYREPSDIDAEDAQFLRDALRYLDLCGLLERREGEPDVVRIRDNASLTGSGAKD